MFKIEYIRTADDVITWTLLSGEVETYFRHKKGTKVNDGAGHSHRTCKYETQKTLDRYCPEWKKRDVCNRMTGDKLDIERFTYQYDGKQWVRIN